MGRFRSRDRSRMREAERQTDTRIQGWKYTETVGEPERKRQGQDRDRQKQRHRKSQRDRDTGGLGGEGAEAEQGVFPVLIHGFEYAFHSRASGPQPCLLHHLPGMSFPRWGFLTWTLPSNRPDISNQRGDSAPSSKPPCPGCKG